MTPGIRWKSLSIKIITWFFVPTAIILLAVALVTYYAYQQVTAELVIERNQDVTRLSARQLATELTKYNDTLTAIAHTADIYQNNPPDQQAAIKRASNRLVVFDGGVLILNTFGTVVAGQPERPEILGQDWSNRSYFREMVRSPGPVFSNVVPDGPEGVDVVVVAVPITGNQGEFRGTMIGMFRLDATAVSAFYGSIVKLRLGESGATYLVGGNGRVIYHSDISHIGEDFSTQAVVQQVLNEEVGAIRTNAPDGQDIVAGFAPVPGTPWGLVTEESWTTLTGASRGYGRFLLLLLALGVVVPIVVVAVGVRRIMQPINALIGAAKEVARGNFGQSITAQTGDEIEELAGQFNLMSAQLQESYANLEQRVADRTRELAILNAIGASVNESLDLVKTLNRILDETLALLDLEVGEIRLLDEESDELVIRTQRGLSAEYVHQANRQKVADKLSERSLSTGEPAIEEDLQAASQHRLARQEGLRAMAISPLRAKEKLLGTLCLATRHGPRAFTQNERNLLRAISDQAAVAIENARLYEQARELAAAEERNRLARELHDSATQSLYGVTMFAEAAARLLTSGQIEQAAGHMREVRVTANEALREMRLLIFELRPPILEEQGLVAALQARLESVEGRSGMQIEFEAEGVGDLPPEVEEPLYRIAQEALNNALKHAQANKVSVCLTRAQQNVILEIADDGVGFDPNTPRPQGGLGLAGMEERAALLGGRVTVKSNPGGGTRVRVEVLL